MDRAEAVLFDLDGTLVDTLRDIADAMNQVLDGLGFPTHPVDAYRMMVGEGSRTLVGRALPGPGPAADLVDLCLGRFGERYAERLVVHSALYPGVAGLLDRLAELGVPASIASNKPHALVLEIVRRLLGRWPWAFVSGQRDGVPRKPAGALALAAAERMGAPPPRCLLVGDSAVDMLTAAAAGMVPIGVSWGFRGREELLAHGASTMIDRPEELLRLVGPPGRFSPSTP